MLTLANRSEVVSKMKIDEAERYVEKLIDGGKYSIFNMRDYKRESGKPAPVALTQTAYKVSMKYITFVRPTGSTMNSPRRKSLHVYDSDNTRQIPPVTSPIRLLTKL